MNQPIRILYVDDYPLDRELVRDSLEREHGGFKLVEAASRADFEAKLSQGGFDLVLSDFNILGFEGLQVLETVQKTGMHLPVIIVTGTGSEEVAAEAIKRGAADYVLKSPKHIQHLPVTIRSVLEKERVDEERRQAVEALRDSNELLSLFVKNSPIYAFIKEVTPTESRVLQASDNYHLMTGIRGEEMVGKNMAELFPAEFAVKITADDWSVVTRGEVLKLDEDLNRRNYTTIKFPIVQGEKTLLAGYTIDITENKQAEEKIRQLNADLEQRVEERTQELRLAQDKIVRQEKLALLGQLAGGVGHELRNPLGIISNAIYYLKLIQPEAKDKVRKYHAMIEQEVHNSEKIIADLLDFARLESMERKPLSVSELVKLTLLRFPVPAGVKSTIRLPEDLPPVIADLEQMQQVLGNITVNAFQAMEVQNAKPGEARAGRLSIIAHQQKGMVAIAVKDNGVGIPPENLRRLFEPLFTTKSKGIGLGLAVSRKLAEANGGRIEVKSEPGKGSTFTLFLPVDGL